jgi:MFS family permease
MVAITSAMVFFASGIFFRGFTVFVPAIRDALGINQAQANLIFSLARAPGGGLEGPAAGWLIDRFGNRKLLVPAILLSAAGYVILSFFVQGFLGFALVYLLMVSLGNSIAFQHAMFAGINQWFRRRRSLAISILAAMGSLGGLALVPSMNLLITHQGWQRATLVCGMFYLLILLPLTIPFRNRPEDLGLLPDGDASLPTTSASYRGSRRSQHQLRDYTVREALHTRAYWLLMLGSGLRQVATLGILVSIVPILESKGLSRQQAANLAGLMFGINFLSRLLMGYLGDRWSKALILGVNLTLESLAAFCLLLGQWSGLGIVLILMFVILEGIGDGAGIMVWAALGEYYGRDRFATLRGYITFAFSWALIASPVYAGWVFDHFGSYDWAILPGGICSAIASLCFFAIRKPPQLTREEPEPISAAGAYP